MDIITLVLIRHGESQWNHENRFTGWCDVDLSQNGYTEAKIAGKLLKKNGFFFDFAYTSMLKRAIHTLWNILDELDQPWLPVEKSWHLNERHYGALQGLNKTETSIKYGNEQVKKWRRSFNIMPPKINIDCAHYPGNDPRYSSLTTKQLPTSESLFLTTQRVVAYWKNNISLKLKNKDRTIVVAHGNSLRALIKYLDNMDETEIIELNIPTGIPIIYKLDLNLKPLEHFYITKNNESFI